MARPNYLEQIRQRIAAASPGTVFIPSDFFDIAEAVKVNVCLNRLKESGELIFVMRGIFSKPRYSKLLKKNVPPYSDDIAKAIARNYGWTIIPCGDTALNMLGLSTRFRPFGSMSAMAHIKNTTQTVLRFNSSIQTIKTRSQKYPIKPPL